MPSRPSAASEIREAFQAFFEKRGHRRVPSASLIPDSDPTLLFTNAGMVPFKRLFLGEETREYSRATSAQKCMRVSGKHNDLENVGRTPRHHTFFEMLGNFSFGDYFKPEAIEYAWEFVTGVLRLPPARLHATVFRDDDDAFGLWRDRVGLPESRIYRLDEADNFWAMGDTGPCGPCSEIYYDFGKPPHCKNPHCDPACDCGRFLEIWNLVFMQFNRDAAGTMTPLPKPSIDTGAGLERLAVVVQGVQWTYETDLFRAILLRAQELSGVALGTDPEKDVSLRVVADHARAVSFLIGDGVLPSNEGRGYVLRRILRRAARHGVLLGLEEPFLHAVSDSVIDEMGGAYPELVERRAYITDRVRHEEERFLETLSKGLSLLEEEIRTVKHKLGKAGAVLPGEVAFRLYDTFGFPLDLTEDILRSHGLRVDQEGFDAAMERQRARARAAWKGSGDVAVSQVYATIVLDEPVVFRGYETLHLEARIRALLRAGAPIERASLGDEVEVVTDQTPFYPESGGQVGDQGEIRTRGGRIKVTDTQRPVAGLVVHRGRVVAGEINLGEAAELTVDSELRQATVQNHSGTHLLHAALRRVLGPQALQKGSLVAPERLRFDFTHDAPLSQEEIERIEDLVNGWIERNAPARIRELPYAKAIEEGAIAIFEEKYGDVVRVISFGDFSTELCGGTHARATGEIGVLKVLSETGIASGVRRIEAQTGQGALAHMRAQERALRTIADLLRAPPGELAARIEKLLEERRALEKELERLRAERRGAASGDLLSQVREIGAVKVLAARAEGADPKELRAMVDELRQRLASGIVMVAAEGEGRVALAIGVTPDLVGRFRAGELVREVAQVVDGKGGGRADFAQAGGRDPAKLEAAIEKLYALVEGAS
ncbi:MAG TPA: alanine--tRNA ligase [Myxococcota bacterium]|nr:alanine--tRNA ligase [Myxococcota bacterium]